MKIAVCLCGYYNTISNGKNNGFESYNKIISFFEKNKIDLNNVDFYIHSWQLDKKEEIEKLYNPKKVLFEKQIDFSSIMHDNDIQQEWFDEGFNRKNTMYASISIFNSLSFSYTRSKSLQLIDNYDQYDYIFSMRLDVGNVGPDSVNFPYKFTFDLSNDYIYTPFWEQINCGLGDMWTILNNKNAKTLSNIYYFTIKYYQKNSDYIKLMTEGWPYSEYFDFNNQNDKRQFSNILLNHKKCEPMKYPKWYCINNHALYKYFFLDNNLINKLAFI